MPRASFSDVTKGGMGFQEGRVLITESYSTMYQYPPNSKTGKQSDPFPALVWKGHKLNNDGEPVTDAEGNFEEVEIVHRMGSIDEAGQYNIRPGLLDPKDFDNLDAEPKDLGTDVDVRGNSFSVDEGAKFSRGWGFIEESLKKLSFKADILGRCVTTDFVGMDAHFKHQDGEKYIAKKGENKGKEVTPSNLVCTRIFTFPYDAKKGGGATKAKTGAGAAAAKTNGQSKVVETAAAADNGGGADDETVEAAKSVFSKISAEFKKEIEVGKEVKRADFQKSMTKELMRQKLNPKVQTAIMGMIKDDAGLVTLAMETAAFVLDDVDKPTTVTLQ